VLLGDALHNFVDGIFIGIGFSVCSASTGWTIAGTSCLHELAQEMADYQLLVNGAKLRPAVALFVNFLSGVFVVIGTAVAIETNISTEVDAVLLCIGGGVYIHLAASGAMPRAYASIKSLKSKFFALLAFMIGAVCIGLVLLDHKHCEASVDGEDPHGGH
jgi:zinc transporter ZupT